MARPSRNLDRALLAAGRALLPEVGCAGLTIRQVAEAAGVNIGMFHYHFRTREAFLRAVLQSVYEEMFVGVPTQAARPVDTTVTEHLRSGFRVLGRFLRDNRQVVGRILADAISGDAVAREFLRDNAPRHITLLAGLIAEGQRRGELKDMPVPQALAFCAGAFGSPIILGGAIADSGQLPKAVAQQLAAVIFSDAAIEQRIDLALTALGAPPPTPRKTAKPTATRRYIRTRD
jgi:AcrR family transcriptional regulator